MATLDTKKFVKPSTDGSTPEQILKMSGYVTVGVQAVHFNRRGKIWTSIFGESDTVAITSRVTYQRRDTTITSSALLGIMRINSDIPVTTRTIASKVPADADSLELSIEVCAVEKDTMRTTLDLLNASEFTRPFELSPTVVGENISTTSFIKRCLADVNPTKRLVASFPGMIRSESVTRPLENNLLVNGQLILISAQDDEDNILDRATSDHMTIDGNKLKFKGKEIRSTYIIFNISTDTYRGYITHSPWFNIFQESLTTLNDLMLTRDEVEQESRYQTAVKLWLEAGALLQNDPMYLQTEKDKIKQDYLDQLITKFNRVFRPAAVGAEGRSILDVPMGIGRRVNEVAVAYHVPTGLSHIIDFKNLRLEDLQRSARTYRDMVKRLN